MICPTSVSGHVFAVPTPKSCNFNQKLTQGDPIPTTYQLFKHNIIEYETTAWLCRSTKQTARLLTYFFGDEHIQEFNNYDILVTPTQCKEMVKTKTSPTGPLHQTYSGLWTTGLKLNYRQPKGGVECCYWAHFEVTNYFLVPAKVYKRHDMDGFRSTAMDVRHCDNYFNGECQSGAQSLIWKPVQETKCEYLPHKMVNGSKLSGVWTSEDEMLALTTMNILQVEDCGKTLSISDQGVAFIEINTHEKPLKSSIEIPQNDRLTPIYSYSPKKNTGFVSSDTLAAWTQGVTNRLIKMTNQAFYQTWKQICQEMESTTGLLRHTVMSDPTGTVRTLLQDPLLYAVAGNGFIEVWKCLPVNSTNLTFMAQEDRCTKEIPVKFQLQDETLKSGYLDPITMIISHQGEYTDCSLVPSVPVNLDGVVWNYWRKEGILHEISNITALKLLSYYTNAESLDLLTPLIYKPIIIYTWEEMTPSEDLNALLATTAARAEVLEMLADPTSSATNSGDDDKISNVAEQVVAKGLASLNGILKAPFHTWVSCTCLIVNIVVIWKLVKVCCHSCIEKMAKAVLPGWMRYSPPNTREQNRATTQLRDTLEMVDVALMQTDADTASESVNQTVMQPRSQEGSV
jgi:hypothetical protein